MEVATREMANEAVVPSVPNKPHYAATGREARLGQRLVDILPNLLLFTAYREATCNLWRKYVKVDTSVKRPSAPIPELDGASFTWDKLKHASNNFNRQPVVVRDLFKDSAAVAKWGTADYLPSTALNNVVIPVVQNAAYGTAQVERKESTFQEAFREVVENQDKRYLFFPVQSRFKSRLNEEERLANKHVQQVVNDLVRQDLPLERIFPGFATASHKRFVGSQLIVGYGDRTPAKTTGTGWHCAFSNNYFVQVAGRKRWYFISPEWSRYLYPLRNGVNSMMTGTPEMQKIQKHIPTSFVDLEPGDMLYNPYWQWHTVMNYEGLSIGVPIREFNLRLAQRNNRLFSGVALANNLAIKIFKRDIGGYMFEN